MANAQPDQPRGLRLATDFDLGTAKATARGVIGWRHAYGDVTPGVSQAFSGSDATPIDGMTPKNVARAQDDVGQKFCGFASGQVLAP